MNCKLYVNVYKLAAVIRIICINSSIIRQQPEGEGQWAKGPRKLGRQPGRPGVPTSMLMRLHLPLPRAPWHKALEI